MESTNVIDKIGEPAMLELLAEECTELAHAALKLARKERGENPTPKSMEECQNKVIEEWADVIICLEKLTDLPWNKVERFEENYYMKQERFMKRLRVMERLQVMEKSDGR